MGMVEDQLKVVDPGTLQLVRLLGLDDFTAVTISKAMTPLSFYQVSKEDQAKYPETELLPSGYKAIISRSASLSDMDILITGKHPHFGAFIRVYFTDPNTKVKYVYESAEMKESNAKKMSRALAYGLDCVNDISRVDSILKNFTKTVYSVAKNE